MTESEPVAWMIETRDERWLAFEHENPDAIAIPFTEIPLYTRITPTEDDIERVARALQKEIPDFPYSTRLRLASAAIAAMR